MTGAGARAALAIAAAVVCLAGTARAFQCGSEQQITVLLDHASMCAGMQGWLAIDEGALNIFEVVDHVPGCTLNTHWFPAAAQRSAVLRWAMMCSDEIATERLRLLTLRAYVRAPTTITGRVDVAVDSALRPCGAVLHAVAVACD